MTRFYFAAAIALLGAVLAVIALIQGQPVTSLSLALASLGVLLGVCQSISNPLFQAAAAIIGAIGLIAVFLYHRSFDTKLQEAHSAVLSSFVQMDIYCKPMPLELQNISYFGVKACAIQDTANQMSATSELAKGLYLGQHSPSRIPPTPQLMHRQKTTVRSHTKQQPQPVRTHFSHCLWLTKRLFLEH